MSLWITEAEVVRLMDMKGAIAALDRALALEAAAEGRVVHVHRRVVGIVIAQGERRPGHEHGIGLVGLHELAVLVQDFTPEQRSLLA